MGTILFFLGLGLFLAYLILLLVAGLGKRDSQEGQYNYITPLPDSKKGASLILLSVIGGFCLLFPAALVAIDKSNLIFAILMMALGIFILYESLISFYRKKKEYYAILGSEVIVKRVKTKTCQIYEIASLEKKGMKVKFLNAKKHDLFSISLAQPGVIEFLHQIDERRIAEIQGLDDLLSIEDVDHDGTLAQEAGAEKVSRTAQKSSKLGSAIFLVIWAFATGAAAVEGFSEGQMTIGVMAIIMFLIGFLAIVPDLFKKDPKPVETAEGVLPTQESETPKPAKKTSKGISIVVCAIGVAGGVALILADYFMRPHYQPVSESSLVSDNVTVLRTNYQSNGDYAIFAKNDLGEQTYTVEWEYYDAFDRSLFEENISSDHGFQFSHLSGHSEVYAIKDENNVYLSYDGYSKALLEQNKRKGFSPEMVFGIFLTACFGIGLIGTLIPVKPKKKPDQPQS